jgi:hypothetical protein
MQRVTAMGGLFTSTKDAKALSLWYDEHAGYSHS